MEFTRREIKNAASLGETLKKARSQKNVSLEQAEEETKVRIKYLKALEEEDYAILPETVYSIGFLAKYADFLELEKESLVDQFKRERGTSKKNSKLLLERNLKESFFYLTPKTAIFFLIVVFIIGIVGYVFYSVRQFTLPPNLEVALPASGQVIKDDKVEIVGKTDGGVTLVINNQMVLIDDKGNFHQQVHLNQGLNTFEVKAKNQLKKESAKVLKVMAEY